MVRVMTHINLRLWHHRLAERLQIKPARAKTLLQAGILPDESCRDFSLRACHDRAYIAAMASARKQFDTPLEPLIDDLRTLIFRLRDGYPEAAPPNRRLVEFKVHDFGEYGGGAYPVDRHLRPWRGHRVAISKTELVEAEYPYFRMVFGGGVDDPYYAGAYKTQTEVAFRDVPMGGEVPLGSFESYYRPELSAYLRLPLADFLERLAIILKARAHAILLGDLPGSAS